jgi:hypothetical protein
MQTINVHSKIISTNYEYAKRLISRARRVAGPMHPSFKHRWRKRVNIIVSSFIWFHSYLLELPCMYSGVGTSRDVNHLWKCCGNFHELETQDWR